MTNLTSFFDTYRPPIDTALHQFIDFHTPDKRQVLKDAMGYSFGTKAKRIRPLLCLMSYQLFETNLDAKLNQILPLACAIEMIHTYSLIHDDLPAMDNDDFRRGQPTCHKQFREDIAILAGDTLNTFAFELCAKHLPQHFDARAVLTCIEKLAFSCGLEGMAGGQVLDLYGPETQTEHAHYLDQTHIKKTAMLIQASLTLPAMLTQQPDSTITALNTYGKQLGLLFQVIDDLLDVTQTKDILGKTPNKDEDQQKLTYISLYGLEDTQKKASQIADEALQTLQDCPHHTVLLEEMVQFISKRQF